MSLLDSYLFEIGWLFFGAWSVIVAVFLVTAFGRDFVLAVTDHVRTKNNEDTCRIVARAK